MHAEWHAGESSVLRADRGDVAVADNEMSDEGTCLAAGYDEDPGSASQEDAEDILPRDSHHDAGIGERAGREAPRREGLRDDPVRKAAGGVEPGIREVGHLETHERVSEAQ